MGIISVKEAQSHAQMVADRSGHNWTCPYIVEVDSARTGSFEIVNYFGDVLDRGIDTPMRYADEHDPFSYCDSIAPVRRDRSQTVWDVTLLYSTPTTDDEREQRDWRDQQGNPTQDPFSWIGDMSIATEYVQVPVWKAWNVDAFPLGECGDSYTYYRAADTLGPVVNSAGVVLDPPLMTEESELVIQLTRNVPWWSDDYVVLNEGHINSVQMQYRSDISIDFELAIQPFPQFTLKCSSVRGRYAQARFGETVVPYWKATVEMRVRPRASTGRVRDGWLESVLDRGLSRGATEGDPDGAGGNYTLGGDDHPDGTAHIAAARGPDGSRIGELTLLDGCGQPLSASSYGAREGVYCRWRKHPTSNFNLLPFPIFQF